MCQCLRRIYIMITYLLYKGPVAIGANSLPAHSARFTCTYYMFCPYSEPGRKSPIFARRNHSEICQDVVIPLIKDQAVERHIDIHSGQ